mmetsp:Transcript_11476/g.44487  ORF Transcript_11476/g.44487 Transcript_11476/m.44487 type:complete len:226 (-) Transcript_11476:516-1193(-)
MPTASSTSAAHSAGTWSSSTPATMAAASSQSPASTARRSGSTTAVANSSRATARGPRALPDASTARSSPAVDTLSLSGRPTLPARPPSLSAAERRCSARRSLTSRLKRRISASASGVAEPASSVARTASRASQSPALACFLHSATRAADDTSSATAGTCITPPRAVPSLPASADDDAAPDPLVAAFRTRPTSSSNSRASHCMSPTAPRGWPSSSASRRRRAMARA